MKTKKQSSKGNKIWLLVLCAICGVLILLSAMGDKTGGPLRLVASYTVVPMEKGINHIGLWMSDVSKNFETLQDVRKKNKELQKKIDTLTQERNHLLLQQTELERLRQLYRLDQDYSDYKKVGARVIASNGSNWFSSFTIDKGKKDGIKKNMNVIAGNGLVGLVTSVGENWSTVRSIIDDESTVSAMMLTTSDNCLVTGDLKMMNDGKIRFERLPNNKSDIQIGEHIVTSAISNRYVQGILIGYVDSIEVDPNNLTRSGFLTPAVDFQHLQEVLVIQTRKEDMTGKKVDK